MCWLVFVALAGCGGSGAPGRTDAGSSDAADDAAPLPCLDPDGDGYGEGAGCLGEDCRQDDPLLQACVCDADGLGTGCPCAGTAGPVACFEGAPGAVNVGTCRTGLRRCEDERWTACEGQVLPADETCDGEDDDCDGVVDDGVLSACGDCNGNCIPWRFGEGGDAFAPEDPALAVVGEGGLTLAAGAAEGSVVLRLETEEVCTVWYLWEIDADVPEGSSILVEAQGGYEPAWATLLELPGEGTLPAHVGFEAAVVELRITLRASPEGLRPTVRALMMIEQSSYCSF